MATIFSGVMLGVMAEISVDLVGVISSTSGGVSAVSSILTGRGAEGIMQTVTQQLGLGLILSTLLITVPPMAGFWFNGMMGQFNAYSTLTDRWNNNAPVPPHVDGGVSYQQLMESKVSPRAEQIGREYSSGASTSTNYQTNNLIRSGWDNAATSNQSTDTLKAQSQTGQTVPLPAINNTVRQASGNSDNAKGNKS